MPDALDEEGCGDEFVLNGVTHTCIDHNPGLLFVHSDLEVIWDNSGRYEDTVNRVIG